MISNPFAGRLRFSNSRNATTATKVKPSCFFAGVVFLLALCTGEIQAEPFSTWTGGGSTPKWSDNNNWNPVAAPSYGTLTFTNGGTQGTTMTNDSVTSMHSLIWGGTSAWTVNQGGSTVLSLFDFGGAQSKVENDSTGLITINAPITYAANNATPPNPFGELNAVNGDITFGSSATLTVNGSSVNGIKLFGGSHIITFNNTVSAAGKWFGHTTGGTGNTVNINGSFTSSDFYVMNGGTLNLNSGGSLSTAIRLGGDFGNTGNQNQTKSGNFNLTSTTGGQTFSGVINAVTGNSSGALAVNSQNSSGINTLSGHLALDTNLLVAQSGSGTLNITQTKGGDNTTGTDIKAYILTLSNAPTSVTVVSGTIYNSTGSGTVSIKGAGTNTLSGANTYTGGTTLNSGSTLNINSTTAIGSGALTIAGNGTFDNTSGGAITLANNNALTMSGGSPTFTGSSDLNFGNGTVTVSGGNRTLTINGGTLTLGGGITDSGGTRKFSKAGAGTLILNGAAGTWTGGASVDTGTLTVGNDTALGTGSLILNGGTLTAGSGPRTLTNAVLLLVSSTIGGANNLTFNTGTFINTNASHTLTVNNSGTTTLGGNVYLSDDNTTVNRSVTITGSGSTVISGPIANNNGANSLAANLTYGGSSTLKLSGPNTYSGTTSVTNGVLQVANASGSGTGSGSVTVNNATLSSGTGNNGGTISGLVTTSGSAPHIKPGGAGAIGTFNLSGGLTLGGTSPAIDFDLSGSSQTPGGGINDEIVVTGTVTLNSTTTINATLSSTPMGPVSYTLMMYGGASGAGSYSIGTVTPTPISSSLTVNSGSLVLNLTYPQVNAYRITAATTSPTVGAGDQLTIAAVDNSGSTVTTLNGDVALTFSGLPTTHGTPTITDKTGATVNQGTTTTLTFVNGVASTSSGAAILKTFTIGSQTLHVTDGTHTDTSTGGASLALIPAAGSAVATTVETSADGSGAVVGAQNIVSGNSVTVYAISRDSFSNFVANPSATWSLQNITGGVVTGDLVANGANATLTGHLMGSAKIQAVASSFTGQSGVQTVVAGSAAQTRVETSADGSGIVVPAVNISIGTSTNFYSISRDANGNFITNVAATWSLQNITGNLVSNDLVAAGDNKSVTFSGHLIGTANVQAIANTSTGQSGTITVTAPITASDNACNYSGIGDWTSNNGGTNFLLWANRAVGSGGGGFFRGSSANNGGSGSHNIDTTCSGNFAWGMFSGGTTLITDSAHIWRPFAGKLQIGQTFTIDMDNGFINNGGSVGFALQNGNQQDLFKFSFTGGQSTYQINNADPSPSIGFTGDGLRVSFSLTSPTNFTVKVATPNTGASTTYTGTLLAQSDYSIGQIVLFSDGAGGDGSFDLFFNNLSISNPTLSITPAAGSLATGTYGTPYNQTITASNGTAPYTYTITAGSLPSGFTLNAASGVISGTPASTNSYSFTVTATDAYGYTGTAAYALSIAPRPVSLSGTRAYDGTTNASAATLFVANAVGADTVNVASGTGGLADKNVGTQSITSFGTLSLGNNPAGNYTLAGASGSVVITQAVTSVSVSSSENPSGYKDSVSFTASLPTDATGSVIFKTNAVALNTNTLSAGSATSASTIVLPRGTNVVTAEYAGDSNYLGSTNDLTVGQIVTNHPPAALTMLVQRSAGLTLKIALADIVTNWSDVDDDAVALSSLNLVTTNNVNLTTNSTWILYTNSPNVNDQISYTIADGQGGVTTGLINIAIVNTVTGTNSISSIVNNGNSISLLAYGIPDLSYVTQRSTNLADWVSIATNIAATNGAIPVTDNFTDLGAPPDCAYYRLSWTP